MRVTSTVRSVSGTPGWFPDPSGRFEHRYHNGLSWTADVSTDGRRYIDVVAPGGPPAPDANPGPAGHTFGPAGSAARPGGDRNGRAVAAMVCGIVSVAIGWVPFVAFAMIAVAVVAIALGAAGVARSRAVRAGRGFAVTGIATGIAGLAASVVGIVLSFAVLDAIERYENPAPHSVRLTGCTTAADGTITATGTITNNGDSIATFAVLVVLAPSASRSDELSERTVVHDLGPGTSREFVARTRRRSASAAGEPECRVDMVNGAIPFGLDPATLD